MTNYNASERSDLGAADYCVLVGTLLISLGIGFFYAWKDRNNQSNDQFLLGGRNMSVAPVAMSLMASFASSTVIMSYPVVVYTRGSHLFWSLTIMLGCSAVAAEIFVPIFFRLNLTSVNMYLFKRFNSEMIRGIASITFIISMLLNMAVVLYGPAIAVKAVTGLSTHASIVILGIICIVYTCIGGLKAVIWTDVVQYCIMIIGLIIIAVKGTSDAGGFFEVLRINMLGGRLEFNNWKFLDLYATANVWSQLLGTLVLYSAIYSSSQMQVQRTCSMPTLQKAKQVIYASVPGFQMLIALILYLGFVMFANYSRCDPLRTGAIERPDEILPHFVSQSLGEDYPGLPGLFVASIFSASLSTLSSGFNALAAMIWDDFLKARLTLDEKHSVWVTKGIAGITGVVTLALTFIVAEVGSIFEASFRFSSVAVAPLFGVFVLGFFWWQCNAKGAIAGLVSGQLFCLVVTIGFVAKKKTFPDILPASCEGCDSPMFIEYGVPFETMKFSTVAKYYPTGIAKLFHINVFMVPVIGFLITLVVGVVVSHFTGGNERPVDPTVMSHLLSKVRGLEKKRLARTEEENEMVERVELNPEPMVTKRVELGEDKIVFMPARCSSRTSSTDHDDHYD